MTHFDHISVKISVLGVLYPYCCTYVGEIWHEEVTFGALLHAKFHAHQCNVSPLWGEKTQNRSARNLNNQPFALCAMLLVKNSVTRLLEF